MKPKFQLLIALPLLVVAGCATAPITQAPPPPPVGPAVQLAPGDQLPVPVVQTGPIYPYELRRRGITGYAVIDFIIDRNGNVRDPVVIETTNDEFGRSAAACVSDWKFKPATKAGQPVNVHMKVPIRFDLGPPAGHASPDIGPR